MNVYIFELKHMLRAGIIWTIGLLAALFAFLSGIYPVFYENIDAVKKVMESYPTGFAEAFGFNMVSMFSFEGFYAFTFSYTSLIGAIMALALTVSIFGREKKSKCMDFILTKPISRKKLFAYKLLSVITVLVLANVLYIISSILLFVKNDVSKNIFLASLTLFLTQLVFVSIGITIVIYSKKIRSVSGIATSYGFSAFVCSALVNIFNEEWIKYIAPLKFFDPTTIFLKGSLDIHLALWAICVIILGTVSSFFVFIESDTRVF